MWSIASPAAVVYATVKSVSPVRFFCATRRPAASNRQTIARDVSSSSRLPSGSVRSVRVGSVSLESKSTSTRTAPSL